MSYTAEIAGRAERQQVRRAEGVMPRSRLYDGLLGALSLLYLIFGVLILLGAILLFLPFFFGAIRRRRGEAHNISTEEGGSMTAIKTLNARAIASACGFGPDLLAARMIRYRSLLGFGGVGRRFAQLYWRSVVLGFRLTKRLWADQLIVLYGSRMRFGEISYLQLRTCWLDDVVERFVETLGGESCQLVILGAGYDTRCLRLALPETVRCFEVDAPGTQAAKRALLDKLRKRDELSAHDERSTRTKQNARNGHHSLDHEPTYVPCDFASESWLDKLKSAGFDPAIPTCFVWEGVTMYLTPETVADTLRCVAQCAPGSIIGFDYLDDDWVHSDFIQRITKRGGEPWQFGIKPGEQSAFVQALGLSVLDDLQYQELTQRYMPRRANGTTMSVGQDFGGFLAAGVTSAASSPQA